MAARVAIFVTPCSVVSVAVRADDEPMLVEETVFR